VPGLLVELGNVVICLHSLRELKNFGSVVSVQSALLQGDIT
jgi:hypothetical protein